MKQAKDNNICRLKRDSHFNFILFFSGACRPMASWVSENITAACTKPIQGMLRCHKAFNFLYYRIEF